MTTRERMLLMFLSDEDRGITPEERKFFDHCNENYKTLFYEPWKEYMTPFRIAGNLYYLGNRLYCVHLIATEEGLILYDSGFQHTAPLIMKGILELGFRPEDVKYVIMTHGHFDHILGVPHIKNEMDVISAIHEDDEICLRDPDMNLMNPFYKSPDFIPSHADMTFRDGDVIRLGETELTVMHTPGHSRGSVCFIDFASRIIFSGDTLFYSTVGRTDTLGGNPAQMDESLRRLIELEGDFTVYTGHGPQTTLSHERVRNIYIRRMNRR